VKNKESNLKIGYLGRVELIWLTKGNNYQGRMLCRKGKTSGGKMEMSSGGNKGRRDGHHQTQRKDCFI